MQEDKDLGKLLARFRSTAISHHLATLEGDYEAVNAATDALNHLFDEIKQHGELGRDSLSELVEDEDPAVQIAAACYSLSFSPGKSLVILRRLAAQDKGIIGFSAQQAVRRWEEGNWNIR